MLGTFLDSSNSEQQSSTPAKYIYIIYYIYIGGYIYIYPHTKNILMEELPRKKDKYMKIYNFLISTMDKI